MPFAQAACLRKINPTVGLPVQNAGMKSHVSPSPGLDCTLVRALREHLQSTTGRPVALVETHISWVLLTDDLAYKLKKPVCLPFVDFSTLVARRHFCEEELRLNRRLAPSLYLDVAPVVGTAPAPRIGGAGEPLDYALRMRRFPPGALLSEMLDAGQLQSTHLAVLAQRLADFHRSAPSQAPSPAFGMPEQVLGAVLEVLAQLEAPFGAGRIGALRVWVVGQAQALHDAWLARHRDGAVRECHGDLHLANAVRIGDDVTAFDCIEFDPALRWTDVMGDVAFLTMDLKAHGRADLAFGFLDDYLQRSGDYGGVAVLRFYEVYRALVRSLVASLRFERVGGSGHSARPDYLACAEVAAHKGAAVERLLITHGVSGTGKSTLARQLLVSGNAIRVRSDVERKRLFGMDALERPAGERTDIYTSDATRRTFERLLWCSRIALQAGYPVIVDAAFLQRDERQAFQMLAAELRVPFAILHCQARKSELRQRVLARNAGGQDASDADVAVLEQQLLFEEPLDADERAFMLDVATDEPVNLAALCASWRSTV
jgi:aminoglycoside phosphotransferase family enzyme/predicted kinase